MVLCSASACWALRCDRLHQVLLVAALRDAQADLGAAPLGEPLGDRLGVLRQRRDQHLLGTRVAALLAVQLLQGVLDQVRRCRRPRPCR